MLKKFHRSNMTQIAQLTGVSIATVSRALNGSSSVKPETRDKILAVAKQVGYSESPVSIITPSCKIISLIVPDMKAEYIARLVDTVDTEARKNGSFLATSTSQNRPDDVKVLMQTALDRKFSGVMLMTPFCSHDLKDFLERFPLPIVLLNSDASVKLPVFTINNYQGAYAMVEHFATHGYKKIGIIRGPQSNHVADQRYIGYKQALEDRKLPYIPDFDVTGDFTPEGGYYAFSRLLSLAERPDAVFITNDFMAVGALEAARRMNVQVPQDIAVAGFDDISMSRFVKPTLTTIHGSIEELGRRAFQYLLKIIHGEIPRGQDYTEELSSGLIVRDSCGCEPMPHFNH